MSSENIRGLSDRSLRNCRQFYLAYPEINQVLSDLTIPASIWQSPTAKSNKELIQIFLLELRKGFCFEARQKRLIIDGEYYPAGHQDAGWLKSQLQARKNIAPGFDADGSPVG